MTEATAKKPTEPIDEADLEVTMPLQTLEHLLQDGDTLQHASDRGSVGPAHDLLVEQLGRIATVSESIERKLDQIIQLLLQQQRP